VPEIPIAQAVERLVKAVEEQLPPDEIQAIYDGWFRGKDAVVKRTDTSPEANKRRIEQLVAHFQGDRGIDEIIALWELVFTKYWDVWYNEIDDLLHYRDEAEAYSIDWHEGTE
jgi:hypothetical protein